MTRVTGALDRPLSVVDRQGDRVCAGELVRAPCRWWARWSPSCRASRHPPVPQVVPDPVTAGGVGVTAPSAEHPTVGERVADDVVAITAVGALLLAGSVMVTSWLTVADLPQTSVTVSVTVYVPGAA